MKKYLLGAACSVIAAMATGTATADTLTYGTYLSAHHATNKMGVETYMRAVEEQTKGSLKFTMAADGTLVGGREALQGLRDGLVDMAMIVDLYTPNELLTSNVLSELGLLGSNDAVMSGAVNELQLLNCPTCETEAAANNLHDLAIYASTPYALICNKNLTKLSDFQGTRIRATGPWTKFVAALGAIPVNITSGETYEALQRGQVDCTLLNIPALTNYSLHEVAKFVVNLPIGTFNGGHYLNMSKSVWDKRSDDEKKALLENRAMSLAKLIEGSHAEETAAREAAIKSGVQFVEPDATLVDALAEFRKNELVRVAELAKSRGLNDPEALFAKFQELITKWEGIVAETGGDTDKYAAALQAEVFSKTK